MERKRLNKLFAEVKEKAKLDFANVCASDYGDCSTCAWAQIDILYPDGRGIFGKYWKYGGNRHLPLGKMDKLYVAHDITPEQAGIFIECCKANGYDVTPDKYYENTCFCISERKKNDD